MTAARRRVRRDGEAEPVWSFICQECNSEDISWLVRFISQTVDLLFPAL